MTFAAEKPPPCHVLSEVALMAAEESGDYEKRLFLSGEGAVQVFTVLAGAWADNPSSGAPALRILSSGHLSVAGNIIAS